MYTAISLATQDMYQPQMHIQTNYTCKVIKKSLVWKTKRV
jgi:hypothetical protein